MERPEHHHRAAVELEACRMRRAACSLTKTDHCDGCRHGQWEHYYHRGHCTSPRCRCREFERRATPEPPGTEVAPPATPGQQSYIRKGNAPMQPKNPKRPPRYLAELVKRRRASPDADEMAETIRRALRAGWTQGQVAVILGCTHQQVSRWANRPIVAVSPVVGSLVEPTIEPEVAPA
ncbi:helix-turn-helix transcriptional regulator [Herbaspirillum sp.]|uniref:helix-turn-helix transcriptional regulator n=1 Tax=Herbaspirillum sp. TaxID=1890675 RepID=UPI00338E3243